MFAVFSSNINWILKSFHYPDENIGLICQSAEVYIEMTVLLAVIMERYTSETLKLVNWYIWL